MNATSKVQRMYSIKEVGPQVGVSSKTIRRWIERGELHVPRLGRQLRISEEDLLAFLSKHRK
jgi:excisionase family DNA binding protein